MRAETDLGCIGAHKGTRGDEGARPLDLYVADVDTSHLTASRSQRAGELVRVAGQSGLAGSNFLSSQSQVRLLPCAPAKHLRPTIAQRVFDTWLPARGSKWRYTVFLDVRLSRSRSPRQGGRAGRRPDRL